MATIPHCLFCFETLVAHLENRRAMTLPEIQKSWAKHVKATAASLGAPPAKRLPAMRRLAASAATASPSSNSSGLSSPSSASGGSGVDTPVTSVSGGEGANGEGEAGEGEDQEDDGGDGDDDEEEDVSEPDESPLFVTWNIASSSGDDEDYSLRGCIGTFESQPLDEGLAAYALTSALQDTRFSPISARELPRLQVVVTLLQDFEDAEDPDDWDIGTHGLRIAFQYHGRRYGATYLPDVAPEQGWTKEETLVSLMRKAGWMGRKDRWRDIDLKVVRYQGRKASLEYAAYRRWRDWVDREGSGK